MNDKFGSCIQFLSTFFTGLIISFVRGWKLTLIILALSPLLFASSLIFTKMLAYLTQNELNSYAKAGAVAEEAITAIRTVFAFNGAQKEHKRYEEKLEEARKSGVKKALLQGILFGSIWLIIQCSYAVGFWFGHVLSVNEEYTVGKVLLVFFSIIMAVFSLGNAGPFLGNISTARGAAYKVFQIIERVFMRSLR
jgi:ABC-type multidrug transport system fused ATPase/permease subunit